MSSDQLRAGLASGTVGDDLTVLSGVDVVAISRIGALRSRDDVDFVERVFTSDEIAYCEGLAAPAEHYAGRWCVKEAVMKILDRPGEVPLRTVEVRKDGPAPVLALHAEAKRELGRTVGTDWADPSLDDAVSISHDRRSDTAVGSVTIVRSE